MTDASNTLIITFNPQRPSCDIDQSKASGSNSRGRLLNV